MRAKLQGVFGGYLGPYGCGRQVASAVWQPKALWNEVRMEREFKVRLKKGSFMIRQEK